MPFNFRRMPDSPGSYYTTQHGGLDHQPMHIAYDGDMMDEDDETPLMTLEDQDTREEGMFDRNSDDLNRERMMDREYDDAGLPV
jgi:hypothetical protein